MDQLSISIGRVYVFMNCIGMMLTYDFNKTPFI
jgi:hypothetical protein